MDVTVFTRGFGVEGAATSAFAGVGEEFVTIGTILGSLDAGNRQVRGGFGHLLVMVLAIDSGKKCEDF